MTTMTRESSLTPAQWIDHWADRYHYATVRSKDPDQKIRVANRERREEAETELVNWVLRVCALQRGLDSLSGDSRVFAVATNQSLVVVTQSIDDDDDVIWTVTLGRPDGFVLLT
jgi:hypothetical protein